MQNKVTVTINDQAYTLVATEDAAYMEKVAAHVDAKIGEIRAGGKISIQDAAVLAALNVADEYFKGQEAAEALRKQMKELLEESASLKLELSKKNQEIFELQINK